MPKKYRDKDEFDVEEVRRDWIEHFCNFNCSVETAYTLVEKTSRELIGLSPLKTNYLGLEPA